jgi:hypothetical protein
MSMSYRMAVAALSGLLLLFVAPAPAGAHSPATGPITGVVLDDDGRPASGITVAVTNLDSGVVPPAQQTDRAGQFRFAGLEPASYTVWFSAPGGAMTRGGTYEDWPGDLWDLLTCPMSRPFPRRTTCAWRREPPRRRGGRPGPA